ncbi:MAG TPA: hypothetical protein VF532_05120 [Candidatus Angelobacter sp.]
MKLNIAHRSSYLPLRDAVLCTDCEFISADAGDSCAVCGSRNLLKLCDLIGYNAGPASLQAQEVFEYFTLQPGAETSPGKTSA